MSWLHLFAADYLIGFFFLTGVILIGPECRRRLLAGAAERQFGISKSEPAAVAARVGVKPAPTYVALVAAVYAIGIIGFFAAGIFTRFALFDGRLWRFPVIALAFLPFFYFDELNTRGSFITAALTRGILGSAIVVGVLTFNRSGGFLVLMTHLLIVFWIGLWLLAGVVRKRTCSPSAAALFSALVQAWLFAAWFITT
jgi:hypothetical protein